jgi:hypothetical protein
LKTGSKLLALDLRKHGAERERVAPIDGADTNASAPEVTVGLPRPPTLHPPSSSEKLAETPPPNCNV